VAGTIWGDNVLVHLYYRGGKENYQYLLENGYALPVLDKVEAPLWPTPPSTSMLENNPPPRAWDNFEDDAVAVQDNHNAVVRNWDE
jgi:hypothetical protein